MTRIVKIFASIMMSACYLTMITGCGNPSIQEADIAKTSLSGNFSGKTFTVKSGSVSKAGSDYIFTLRNYEWKCTGNTQGPPADALLVSFSSLNKKAGLETITLGSQHAASLQEGVGSSANQAKTTPVESGLLRLDNWSEKVGESIKGALLFKAENIQVNGTFTATICK